MGQRGYIAYRMLVQNGFKCKNISGGYKIYMAPKADLTVTPSTAPLRAEETTAEDFDFEVNACGVPCPGPIMKLAKKMKEMEPGQVLKITASDVGFSKDVPGWCQKTGNELLSMSSAEGIYTAIIRKS